MDPIRPIPNTSFYFHTDKETWDGCKSASENNGFTFASIRNQAENDAVVDYLKDNNIVSVWLGGYQTSFDDEPAGNWAWLDGTAWADSTYTNWAPSQPDNKNNNQHYLRLKSENGEWWDVKIGKTVQCLFRDPLSSFTQKIAPTSEPTSASKIAPTTVSVNIETLTSTVLSFFESIVTFFKNLLPF